MSSHGRHARPRVRKSLRATVLLGAATTAGIAAAGPAQADVANLSDPLATVGYAVAPVTDLQLYPLANTGFDPLSNGVEAQPADFQPVGTTTVTGPLTDGASLSDLAGDVTGLLR